MTTLYSFTRVFNIPELGDYICALFYIDESEETRSNDSDSDEETDIAAFTSLLHTCRATFRPAARRIWGAPVQVEHLLSLLPGVSVVSPSFRLSYWVIQETDVPEYTALTFLDRFKLYAPFVKSLRVENVFWPDDNAEDGQTAPSLARMILEQSAKEGALLPNLKSLAITTDEGHPDNLERLYWATMLLSPSILSLKLIGTGMNVGNIASESSRMDFTTAALRKCVNIEKLELEFFNDEDDWNLSGLLPRFFDSSMPKLSRLRRLVCRQSILCPEFLQWLQSIPNLESLELDCLIFESDLPITPLISPDSFLSLSSLEFRISDLKAAICLFQTPLVHHLSTLEVDVWPCTNLAAVQLVREFVDQVKESCPRLTQTSWSPPYSEPVNRVP
ncbi:hypothetical protein FRC12_012307 [Ceratobasidium sp. 428]|nr:hypothetical protein FRC12_012307 [Ceratobasidium sp. 428]